MPIGLVGIILTFIKKETSSDYYIRINVELLKIQPVKEKQLIYYGCFAYVHN